jgi:soluble lytic murein transglycosylase-like protein
MALGIRLTVLTFVFTVGFLSVAPVASHGEIYRYEGEDGVVHYTNVPTDPRFRRMRGGASAHDIQDMIFDSARRYNVDPNLIKAVIKVESNFNPKAVSKAGAVGLMQLMPATSVTLNVGDPFNPHENIRGGVKHLSGLLYRFEGDLPLALAAYHAGETRVRRYGAVPPIEQTQRYVRKVLAAYRGYRNPY